MSGKKFVNDGNSISCTASGSDAVAGVPYIIGQLVVVPHVSAVDGADFEGTTKGVWNIAKTSANTPAQFANAYWDDTAKEVTTTATANTLIGVFAKAYGNGDTEADVILNGVSV